MTQSKIYDSIFLKPVWNKRVKMIRRHRYSISVVLFLLFHTLCTVQISHCFLASSSSSNRFSQRRFLVEDDQEISFGNSEMDTVTSSSPSVFQALKDRQQSLKLGIGKRYVTRTQRGFLNVHYEPVDPHKIDNVVGQLEEGQIVTSTGPSRGFWIPHDAGGWSIAKYGGFTWLEPIDE